jgi:electron transfer flavoprotein beta subunit
VALIIKACETVKLLVPIKRVLDVNLKPRIQSDGLGIETKNLKMSANPFDEIALEEALRLKEKGKALEVIIISVGEMTCQETLRAGLAMGADRGILLQTAQALQPLQIAKLLKIFVEKEQINLVIMGKQAIDNDANQTGQMLAALLDWPQGTFASKISCLDSILEIEREIDGGHQVLQVALPAVVTVDLRLNTPRFTKLPEIMKARQKKIDIISAESLGVDLTSRLILQKISPPKPRQRGQKVKNVDQLLSKLREEARVIS